MQVVTIQGQINEILLKIGYIGHGYLTAGKLRWNYYEALEPGEGGYGHLAPLKLVSFRLNMSNKQQEMVIFDTLEEAQPYAVEASNWYGNNFAPYAYFAWAVGNKDDIAEQLELPTQS